MTIAAGALFSLLALTAAIVTDLHDREFPQALGTQSRVTLDFSESNLTITESFAALRALDARWGLGLLKIAPDLVRDGDGRVFVALNDTGLPAEFPWFGGEGSGEVVGPERLAHSLPDGSYLVTGALDQLDELVDPLTAAGVSVVRSDASIVNSLTFVALEGRFAAAVLAACALIAALALFWLSMRARARALRVLGGCPATRIHVQDLGGLAACLVAAASLVAIAAVVYVGVAQGWVFTGAFMRTLGGLQLAVISVSLLAALVMSATAWPSAAMLATRQPAVRSLRSAATVIQTLTFLLVLAAAAPAWSSYQRSTETAAETAQWRQLADQVALVFAMDLDEMDSVEPLIGDLVQDAEARGLIAHSYTFGLTGVDLGDYSAVSLVNQRWLDLVTPGAPETRIVPVSHDSVPEPLLEAIRAQVEVLSRHEPVDDVLATFGFLRPSEGSRLPVADGGGALLFADDTLLVVVPSVHEAYNDRTLTSLASGRYIVFTGVGETQHLLERHGLAGRALRDRGFTGQLHVVYLGEDGLLRAQFAAYVVWLLNLALVALVVAFTVAAAISALITALLQARRDFPLRLAGQPWVRILQARVAKELLAGAGLVAVVVVLQRPEATGAVLVAAAFGLVVMPLSHLLAARWCFAGIGRRRI